MTADLSTDNPQFHIAHYRQLAELRFRIRTYLQLTEQVARTHGIEPQQHQLMLAIKGLPENITPTVSALANRLCLRHHSTVELINRLVDRGAALRKPSTQDRRQVLVELTPIGEELLEKLSSHHGRELHTFAPELIHSLNTVLHSSAISSGTPSPVSEDLQQPPEPLEASANSIDSIVVS